MSGKVSGLVFEFYPVGGGEMLTAYAWPTTPTTTARPSSLRWKP